MELDELLADGSDVRPLPDLDRSELYLNRELSWLEFNQRVLSEAYDPRQRLLDRLKFLAITASNLDEFYTKRVGWLKRVLAADPLAVTVDGLTVAEQLDLVVRRAFQMQRDMEKCWSEELSPALAERGIRIVKYHELDPAAQQNLTAYFESAIFPVLTPLVVDPAHPFPFISSLSLSLALNVRHPVTGQDRFARIKVPQNRPRFVDAGDMRFVPLEEVIAGHLDMLFPGMEVTDWQAMRVIRSAEIGSPGEESEDLLELIENELRRRRLAEPVTAAIVGEMPPLRLELLLEELELPAHEVYLARCMLGMADLMQLGNLPFPDLSEPSFTPAVPSEFSLLTEPQALFAAIRDHDILVHHPYESFDATVARFIDEAAADPAVLAIKQTMYRTSPDSPILASLIDAAGLGKQVAVLVELTARFDEANNIEWARRLESAGVHVAYGNPNQKIHSKICLVVREEPGGVTMYAHIGTGNYNSRTARLYTDLGLFTADHGITSDLVRVFNHLTGYSQGFDTEELLVAPMNLRSELESRVRREIEHARAGLRARIVFKANALEDPEFTRLLYEASGAGVQVDLIIRGICRLRPGLPGISENVRVVSIIGRFLEHSRVYYFANNGDPEYFIGSADIMKRNLDERIEVLAPVRRPELQRELDQLLDLCLQDTRQAWRLQDSTWTRDQQDATAGVHALLLARAPFS